MIVNVLYVFLVPESPKLGESSRTYGQIIINQNDRTNGVLQLSQPSVTVAEDSISPVVNVVRSAGAFGQVKHYHRI